MNFVNVAHAVVKTVMNHCASAPKCKSYLLSICYDIKLN